MASPLTADETTRLFKVFGIPQNGAGFVAGRIISLYGPAGNNYDFTQIVTQINNLLNLITATQYTQIQNALTEYEAITDWSELKVSVDQGTGGEIVNHDKRRRNIRKMLSNIVGFFCPEDGFFTDSKQVFAGAGPGGMVRVAR